jgi:hypothetical protein
MLKNQWGGGLQPEGDGVGHLRLGELEAVGQNNVCPMFFACRRIFNRLDTDFPYLGNVEVCLAALPVGPHGDRGHHRIKHMLAERREDLEHGSTVGATIDPAEWLGHVSLIE